MTRPLYVQDWWLTSADVDLQELLKLPWLDLTEARRECFMSEVTRDYVYGSGRGQRTYTSIPFDPIVLAMMLQLNTGWGTRDIGFSGMVLGPSEPRDYNICFLNRYDGKHNQLGWHSDDSPTMDHDHPIAVVSLGQPREIWWRRIGEKGIVPPEQRQLLGHGSLFVMPPGFQRTHQHRIPKGDREMGTRVSLTFRRYED